MDPGGPLSAVSLARANKLAAASTSLTGSLPRYHHGADYALGRWFRGTPTIIRGNRPATTGVSPGDRERSLICPRRVHGQLAYTAGGIWPCDPSPFRLIRHHRRPSQTSLSALGTRPRSFNARDDSPGDQTTHDRHPSGKRSESMDDETASGMPASMQFRDFGPAQKVPSGELSGDLAVMVAAGPGGRDRAIPSHHSCAAHRRRPR